MQAGIFNAAVFFVFRGRGEDRFRHAHEVNSIGAFRIAEARSSGFVLGTIEHHEFASFGASGMGFLVDENHSGIEGAGGLPVVILRSEDRGIRGAFPGGERIGVRSRMQARQFVGALPVRCQNR